MAEQAESSVATLASAEGLADAPLAKSALEELEEARGANLADAEIGEMLSAVSENLAQVEQQKNLFDLFGGVGGFQ